MRGARRRARRGGRRATASIGGSPSSAPAGCPTSCRSRTGGPAVRRRRVPGRGRGSTAATTWPDYEDRAAARSSPRRRPLLNERFDDDVLARLDAGTLADLVAERTTIWSPSAATAPTRCAPGSPWRRRAAGRPGRAPVPTHRCPSGSPAWPSPSSTQPVPEDAPMTVWTDLTGSAVLRVDYVDAGGIPHPRPARRRRPRRRLPARHERPPRGVHPQRGRPRRSRLPRATPSTCSATATPASPTTPTRSPATSSTSLAYLDAVGHRARPPRRRVAGRLGGRRGSPPSTRSGSSACSCSPPAARRPTRR